MILQWVRRHYFQKSVWCPICGKGKERGQLVCRFCRIKIDNYAKTNPKYLSFMRMYRVYAYREEFRQLHLRLKYGGQTHLAPLVATLMLQAYLSKLANQTETADLIVFIPSTHMRMGQRGFNVSELLARQIGQALDKEVVPLLCRHGGKKQTDLSGDERIANMQETFFLSKKYHKKCIKYINPRILLIDDVRTSGATMNSAASVLLEGGYERIVGLCFLSS